MASQPRSPRGTTDDPANRFDRLHVERDEAPDGSEPTLFYRDASWFARVGFLHAFDQDKVALDDIKDTPTDGYTMLMALSSISVIPEADKLFNRKPAYTLDQLDPIALISADPMILVVHPSLPVKTVKEVIALARKPVTA